MQTITRNNHCLRRQEGGGYILSLMTLINQSSEMSILSENENGVLINHFLGNFSVAFPFLSNLAKFADNEKLLNIVTATATEREDRVEGNVVFPSLSFQSLKKGGKNLRNVGFE